jgi:hypothetical protein
VSPPLEANKIELFLVILAQRQGAAYSRRAEKPHKLPMLFFYRELAIYLLNALINHFIINHV